MATQIEPLLTVADLDIMPDDGLPASRANPGTAITLKRSRGDHKFGSFRISLQS